jgi:hypothetical protein
MIGSSKSFLLNPRDISNRINVTIGFLKTHFGKAFKNAYRGPKETNRSALSRHPIRSENQGNISKTIDFARSPLFSPTGIATT